MNSKQERTDADAALLNEEWDAGLFVDEDDDEPLACGLENPDICESCQ